MINLGRRVIFSSINTKRYLSSSKEPVWHKSSSAQATIILIGCVAFEFFYGSITESIWESLNKGKLFHHYQMDRFKLEGQEDE